jgi:hypothetical protein
VWIAVLGHGGVGDAGRMSLEFDKHGKLKLKRNKYGVAPKEERTYDGIVFASKREATRYRELLLMQQCGGISNLSLQPGFTFPPGFRYVADFRYLAYRGKSEPKWIIEDVKGVETAVFKIKLKCMKYFYPDVELRVIR